MTVTAEVEETSHKPGTCVLVLGDVSLWSQALEDSLFDLGLNVVRGVEIDELLKAARSESPALVVLAKRNPSFAIQTCRTARHLHETPVLAVVPSEEDLIPVLEGGADDAVVAVADPRMFGARARALLRRVARRRMRRHVIVVRDLTINLDTYQISFHGRAIPLTPTEFRILAMLGENAGSVLDARTLLSAINQHTYTEKDAQSLVKVHIANLRRKLSESGVPPTYVVCVRGFGYMLERRSQARAGDPLAGLIEEDPRSDPWSDRIGTTA